MNDKAKALFLDNVPVMSRRATAARFVPVFRNVDIIDIRSRYAFPPHQHDAYEIILVDRGPYLCTVNGREIVLGEQEVLVVKPGDWHEDVCEPPLRYFVVGFELTAFQGSQRLSLYGDNVEVDQQHFKTNENVFGPLVRRIQEEGKLADAAAPQIQNALLSQFFWTLVRALPPEVVSRQFLDLSFEETISTQLMRIFDANINTTLSVARMAAQLRMSESSFAHACKRVLGVSPMRAFRQHKMLRALTLLKDTDMSVKEVGAFLGFDDPYHFSRMFRNMFGYPPSESR